MKNEIKQKTCIVCKEPFTPHPKVGDRQKVCEKSYCKLQRKKLAQQNWLSKNPGYFKGRYPQLKEQILANKKQNPRSRRCACPGIQDKLISNQNKLLTILEIIMGIQDELTSKITESKHYLIHSLNLVYKTS